MNGTLVIGRRSYRVVKSELHVPLVYGGRHLYLSAEAQSRRKGARLALYGVELALLDSIEELDGKRLHVHPDGETYGDDTLGTDIIGRGELDEEESLWQEGDVLYEYGDIQIDFTAAGRRRYRCKVDCTLAKLRLSPVEVEPRRYRTRGTASFLVTPDEIDPIADCR